MGMPVGLGIGIHQGNVILGSVGASELMRYTVIGNAVNIAHRLVDFAEDKEIVISDDVYQSGCRFFTKMDIQRQEGIKIKGMDEKQTLYRIKTAA
jgi:adenylate cyclase